MMNVKSISFTQAPQVKAYHTIDNNLIINNATSGKSYGWMDRIPAIHEFVRSFFMWLFGKMDITAPSGISGEPPIVFSVKRSDFMAQVKSNVARDLAKVLGPSIINSDVLQLTIQEAITKAATKGPLEPSFLEYVKTAVTNKIKGTAE